MHRDPSGTTSTCTSKLCLFSATFVAGLFRGSAVFNCVGGLRWLPYVKEMLVYVAEDHGMKFPSSMQQVVATGVAAAMGLSLAGATPAQVVVDEATQSKATALGTVLLSEAKWSTAQANPPTY